MNEKARISQVANGVRYVALPFLSKFLEDSPSKTVLDYTNMLSGLAFASAFLNMINGKSLWTPFTS